MKRIQIITGHFGSGKTEFAVNFAKYLKKNSDEGICLVDLDLVNPYFRSREKTEVYKNLGIEIVSSDLEGEAADIPSISARIQKIFDTKNLKSIIDLGGDSMGATALRRFRESFIESEIEVWFVMNANRPNTQCVETILDYVKKLETAIELKVSGIINATHMLKYTTSERFNVPRFSN
ncbi:MAG: ATP-binding protein [Fusobacteria bacterium]|nr:ATP-binding protein [Fusobacteriota bacterium]